MATKYKSMYKYELADAAGTTKEEMPIPFHVKEPFIYRIRERETGTVLFIGEMQKM